MTTRAIKGPDGKVTLVTAADHEFTGDKAEEAIDRHTDKVMMGAMRNEGMDLPALKLLAKAVGVWNVVVALDHMANPDLVKLCKRLGVTDIPYSSNADMRKAIVKLAGLEDDKREGEDYVFSHGLIFVGMKKSPSAFLGQRANIRRAMMAYEKAKKADAKKDAEA